MKISKEIEEVKNEIDKFNNKLNLSPNNKDEETEIMLDILRSLKEKNVDIYEGLNKNQIEFLNEMMKESDDVNNNEDNNLDSQKEGEKYANAIEDIANRIYNQNLISEIKIEQINDNVYTFNDKEVVLKFDENNQLKLIDGSDLEKWIINTFKLPTQSKNLNVVKQKKTAQNNKMNNNSKKGKYS